VIFETFSANYFRELRHDEVRLRVLAASYV
jgi:hypothetical protein